MQVSPPDPAFWNCMRAIEAAGAVDRPPRLPASMRSPRPQPGGSASHFGIRRRPGGNATLMDRRRHPHLARPRPQSKHLGRSAPRLRSQHARGFAGAGSSPFSDGFARVPFLQGGSDLDSAAALGSGREKARPLDHLRPPQYRARCGDRGPTQLPHHSRGAIHFSRSCDLPFRSRRLDPGRRIQAVCALRRLKISHAAAPIRRWACFRSNSSA